MVDHDEEDGRSVVDPLQGGSGDDLTAADRPAGLEVGDERLAHGGAEFVGKGSGTEGEDALDVGLDPAGVEGGNGTGEALDQSQLVGIGGRKAVGRSAGGSGDSESGEGDPSDQGDTGSQSGSDETADHDETLPHGRLATWVAAFVLVAVGIGGFVVAAAEDETSDREEVLEFSEEFIELFTAYDHTTFEETEAAVAQHSTLAFASRYRSLLGGSGFVSALRENEAKATSEISVGPLVATLADHEARTFAIVEQEVTGRQFDGPQRTRLRVEVMMVETPDGWIVTDVETT